jgi:hypothetical protein
MIAIVVLGGTVSVLPPTTPPWPPTYNMSLSTLTMAVNGSGWSSPERGAQFGIVSYDWSNAKAQWAAATPMDCEERLLEQAQMTKARSGNASKVFVYRNLVKALPWFTSVREKLLDPAYQGWFLRFRDGPAPAAGGHAPYAVPPCAAENGSKCSGLYHDQGQTPQVPTAAQPQPDGSCGAAADGGCDCGAGLPCGEYLWDHRNGSMLREWLVREHIGGAAGLSSPAVDGMFVDDFWCSDVLCAAEPGTAGCPCTDPVQGPTEVDRYFQYDSGLSDDAIALLTLEWNRTMSAFQASVLAAGAYTWSLIPGQENANASPDLLHASSCAAAARARCGAAAPTQSQSWLFGLTHNGSAPAQVEQDVAFFLLARGPYAWLGWGSWGMGWPFNAEPAHGGLPPQPHGVPRPAALDTDYGEPAGHCEEASRGVFRRAWTKADVELDCNTWKATIKMKG